MILDVRNLSVSFVKEDGTRTNAVNGLNFRVEKGSFTSLVGESGSGKSVTALSVAGLVSANTTTGDILYYGGDAVPQNTRALATEELTRLRGKEISYIFQDPGTCLNPVLKIGEQITETYLAHFRDSASSARDKALEQLSAVKIKDPERVFKAYPHELSGGMKQRVMMAMALITGSRLLIADEPTTALDVATENEILTLFLKARRERGLSILFITHDLSLAAAYSDAIYVMQSGRAVECLVPKSGVVQGTHPYTQKLFAARLQGVAPKTIIGV